MKLDSEYDILTKNWAVSNRPAVNVSVLGYPSGLVKDTDNKDTTWIRLTCVWFYNCQAGRFVMSSSKLMPAVTRPRTIEQVPRKFPKACVGFTPRQPV